MGRSVNVLASAVGLFIAGALSGGAAPVQSSADGSHALVGTVLDLYTKQPYSGLVMRLSPPFRGCDVPEQQVTTNAQGMFRFDNVPKCKDPAAKLALYGISGRFALQVTVTPEGASG